MLIIRHTEVERNSAPVAVLCPSPLSRSATWSRGIPLAAGCYGLSNDFAGFIVAPEVRRKSLELDACSSAADRELRQMIRSALDAVVQIDSVVHVAAACRDGRVDLVHVDLRPRGAEAALTDWLRRQPGLPGDPTIGDWQAMRDAGAAPGGIDAVVRAVPIRITPRDDAI